MLQNTKLGKSVMLTLKFSSGHTKLMSKNLWQLKPTVLLLCSSCVWSRLDQYTVCVCVQWLSAST